MRHEEIQSGPTIKRPYARSYHCRTMGKPNDDVKGSDNGAADHCDSFPEHSLPPPPPESLTKTSSAGNRTTLATIAGVAGNVLEWYDFAIFGYFSDVIGDVFFPPQSGHAALAQSFAVFGGAFLARPREYMYCCCGLYYLCPFLGSFSSIPSHVRFSV